jgi:hypothetical protein
MVVLLHDGNIDRKRACNTCVRRGVLITTMPRATPALMKAPLDADEKDVREVLRRFARHLRGLAKGMHGTQDRLTLGIDHKIDEQADGIDQAADIADAWAARPEIRR